MTNLLLVDDGYQAAFSRDPMYRGGSVDMLKLRRMVERLYGKLYRAVVVTSLAGENQFNYHAWLKYEAGYEVVAKSQKSKWCPYCGNGIAVERGVDVEIATLAIKYAHLNKYDRLILFNGDADLLAAVRYIRDDLGKEVILIGSESTTAKDMVLYTDGLIDLTAVDIAQELYRERDDFGLCGAADGAGGSSTPV